MTDVLDVPRLAELPVLGSTLSIQRDLLGFYRRAVESGLPLVRVHAGVPGLRLTMVIATSPEAVEEVLTRREFTKQARPYRELAGYIGDGLLTLDGDAWLAHRRLLQPLFTPRQVAASAPVVEEEAGRLVAELAEAAPAGQVDLAEASIRYALRVIARLVFGPGAEEITRAVGSGFPALNSHIEWRSMVPFAPPRDWPTPGNIRAERARRQLVDVVDRLVAQAPGRTDAGVPDLVSRLVAARDPDTGAAPTPEEVRAETLLFLLAGYETTATAVTATLHLMGAHPEWQDRVRAEAAEGTPGAPLAWAVVQEAMRLYPSALHISRTGPDGAVVLGHRIPSGALVVIPISGLHRNPRVFPDSDRFDPTRFLGTPDPPRHRYAYVPFGAGPRACIGAQLARLEAVTGVREVVRSLDVRTGPGGIPVTPGVTLRPRGRVPAQVRRRAR